MEKKVYVKSIFDYTNDGFRKKLENEMELMVEKEYFPIHSLIKGDTAYIIFYKKPERP